MYLRHEAPGHIMLNNMQRLSDMQTGGLDALEAAALDVDHHTEHNRSTKPELLIEDMLDVIARVETSPDGSATITRDQAKRLIRATYFLVHGLIDTTEDDPLGSGQNTMALARQIEIAGGQKIKTFLKHGEIHTRLAWIIAELSEGTEYHYTRARATEAIQEALGNPGAPPTAPGQAKFDGAYFNRLAEDVMPISTPTSARTPTDVSEADLTQTAWMLRNLELEPSDSAGSVTLDSNRWYALDQGTRRLCLAAADLVAAKRIVEEAEHEDPHHRLGTAMQAIAVARKIFGETDSTESNFRGVLIAATQALLDGNLSNKAKDLAAEIAKVKIRG